MEFYRDCRNDTYESEDTCDRSDTAQEGDWLEFTTWHLQRSHGTTKMKRSLALGLPEQPISSREVLSSKLKQGHVCFLTFVHVQPSFLWALLLLFLFFFSSFLFMV